MRFSAPVKKHWLGGPGIQWGGGVGARDPRAYMVCSALDKESSGTVCLCLPRLSVVFGFQVLQVIAFGSWGL